MKKTTGLTILAIILITAGLLFGAYSVASFSYARSTQNKLTQGGITLEEIKSTRVFSFLQSKVDKNIDLNLKEDLTSYANKEIRQARRAGLLSGTGALLIIISGIIILITNNSSSTKAPKEIAKEPSPEAKKEE
ncbi:hypothetical protein KJ632_03345 [Patescibacteria group bacterium]|nr:hypothetical protein [Patescibacteria group bacterium]